MQGLQGSRDVWAEVMMPVIPAQGLQDSGRAS